jgi:hypothetical protein
MICKKGLMVSISKASRRELILSINKTYRSAYITGITCNFFSVNKIICLWKMSISKWRIRRLEYVASLSRNRQIWPLCSIPFQILGIDYFYSPPEIDQPAFSGQNLVRYSGKSRPAHPLQGIRMNCLFLKKFGLVVVRFSRRHHVLLSWRRLRVTLLFYNIVF